MKQKSLRAQWASMMLVFTLLWGYSTVVIAGDKDGNYHALIIAVDTYNSKTWIPLKTPVSDAKAIEGVLSNKYGFKNITTLYNEAATRANIIEKLDKITSQLTENDNLLIYYSGHGIEIANEGYWVPVEAKSQERYELLATTEVKNALTKTQCKHVLVMVDACFSSTIFKSSNLFITNDGSDAYYARISSLISRQAITAGGLEPVPDGVENHSVFAKYLIKFLENNAKTYMDASELYELIRYPVAANTPNMPQFGHIQNAGHEGGQFVFRFQQEQQQPAATTTTGIAAKLCDSEVFFKEGENVQFDKDGGTLHAMTDFKNVRYEWTLNSDILDHEGPELKVTKSGLYGVTVIAADGECSNAALARVEIVLPQVVVDILEGNSVQFTHTGTLNATLTGYAGEVIYEWKKGNFLMSSKSSLEVSESEVYTVTAKLPDGRVLGSASTTVTINNRVYEVQLGDNVRRIATKFFGDPNKEHLIYAANPTLKKDEELKIGTLVRIPNDDGTEQTQNILTIVGGESFAPFSAPTSFNGGLLTDLIKAVYVEMEQPINLDYRPNNELRSVVYSGRATVGYPFTMNSNETMLFLFSEPLYQTLNVFFVKQESEVLSIEKTMKDRMKKTKYHKLIVAVPIGFNSDQLKKYYEDRWILLKAYPTLEASFEALSKGEVEMVAAPQVSALVMLQNTPTLQRSDFRILEQPIETNTFHLVVSKEHPNAEQLIQNFNAALANIKANGVFGKITDMHIDLIQKGNP